MSIKSDSRSILTELLTKTIELGASDLHLRVDSPPQVRINGKLRPLDGHAVLGPDEAKQLACSFITEEQGRQFDEKKELDFSIGLEGLSRFRVNIF
ncbi:MAG: type IV pili twitching motility protein PilT, partial [Acidobacteriota bacterium]